MWKIEAVHLLYDWTCASQCALCVLLTIPSGIVRARDIVFIVMNDVYLNPNAHDTSLLR